MKVLVSRRPFSPRLYCCLVLCCCLILLGSRGCNARIITEENSAPKVAEVHEDLKSSLAEAGRVDEELKTVDEVDVVNEKRLRQVTETLGKSDKENEDAKVKDVSVSGETENDKYIRVDEKIKEHLTVKTLFKSPLTRLKRGDQIANEKIDEGDTKSVEDKTLESNDFVGQNKRVDVEGIRRLDIDVEEEDKKENHEISEANLRTAVPSNFDNQEAAKANIDDNVKNVDIKNIEHGRSEEIEKELQATGISSIDGIAKETTVAENPIIDSIKQTGETDLRHEKSEEILKRPQEVSAENENGKMVSSRAENLSRLQFLKAQAIELQEKIRNSTFLQSLKGQMSEILPDIPKFTENQFLDMLKIIMSKRNIQQSSDFNYEIFKDSGLNENQIEIIKCAQQLVAQRERQSFFDNMSECIRGLNVINCMRIFIYPVIVENMPEVITQVIPNFPIEINVADIFQGNRDRPKSARQVPVISFYSNQIDPEAMIFDILMEGLLRNPPIENLPSFIEAKNETFSKLLTCNRMQLLQMTEKFLPQNARESYSDEMLSCVRRFEYFSCIKYFSWPAIKQYYAALPQFPLSDYFLSSLIYPNYPLITYPGFESGFGHLPEVVESGPKRRTPETVIMHIFKQTLSEYPRIATPPTPVYMDLVLKNQAITQEQMTSIHLAEQLLPVNLRSEYVSKTVQCIRQFDYYNCIKYATWPVVRQFNPSIPEFPSLQDIINNFQIPELPQIPNLFDFFSQFQLPQFQLPQFQLPELPNFNIPNFNISDLSSIFPFGQLTSTTPKPTADNPAPATPTDTVQQDNKKNSIKLEAKIYDILKNVRDSMGATPLSPATYTNRKVFLFPLMTEEQSKIFALAEGIVPPIAREPLITNIYFCLNDKNEFSTCARTIIWPSIRSYVRGLPEFPVISDNLQIQQQIDVNVPFVTAPKSADNFFIMREIEKLFFEGREDAMRYIIRSIELSTPESFNMQKVLEILRSIQFNTPDFSNMQSLRYPRTPEFVSTLTENQENIVHAIESILPEQIRPKFYTDMIDCAQKNKFPICSRTVIFPSIYPYFQRSLFDPYYNVVPEKKNFSKISSVDLNRIHPIRIETKVNTEKQGENIIITTDKKFMPIYPSNPESIIFSILRKVQISAKSLPDFPKKSIAYTPEFKQAFNVRQSHILTVAEGILPDEYRKGLLEEIYVCNQKDSFLNCTRDKLFPVMAKAFPDFPLFPDFKHDLDRSNMLSVIDSFNQSLSSLRSYDSKRTLPSIDVLYKFVPENKSDGLRIMIDKLPDTLYYDLYVKMTQCTQYSDSISCGHDIIYPTLKKYYDAPGFNVDNYYPITTQPPVYSTMANQRTSFDYEMLCENMGFMCTLVPFGTRSADGYISSNISPSSTESSYIPFGRLADGSRIFKHTEDIWNTNITPSVGADKSSIPEHAGRPSTNYLNFATESTFIPEIQQKNSIEIIRDVAVNFLKRNKRNVDDLLDSYPDVIPNGKKNSVPRRIPPKLTFPNMTETELLQILIHISKLKNDRTSENENIVSNEYFVDSLNDTEKALITRDQYEILKLIQVLNSETSKAGFMSRLIQCIRSLSFIRCIGIFVWPMIVSNLPSLPFTFSATRDSRGVEEMQIQELFGVTSSDFETELLSRREQIESNFVELYKSLTEEKFEADIGPLKVKGYGDGELAITFSGFREGRLSRFKDNKNLPSILSIISEVIEEVFDTKPKKTKIKKDNSKKDKRGRSLHDFEESNFEKLLRDSKEEESSKRSVKDDQVINMLLDRLRPSVTDIEDEDMKHYFSIEDAYRAFQVLFGPKVTGRISNQLKFGEAENIKRFEGLNLDDELKLVPLEEQKNNPTERLRIRSPKSRAIYQSDNDNNNESNNSDKNVITSEKLSSLKAYLAEHIKKYLNLNKKKIQSGLTLRLPRLNDEVIGRKMTNSLSYISRGLKTKMKQMMPAAGLAVSFLVQLALAHAKAAASVAGILSNMALGSAMLGMVRDMVFGSNSQPKIKYVYDTEKYDAGISWPHSGSDPTISYTPPSPHYHPY